MESDQFWFLYEKLPVHQRPVALFAYETGCRKTEILSLQWKQIDFLNNVVRLNPGETKNDEGRVIPLSDMMMFLLNKLPRVSEFVFTYRGRHLKSIRTGWENALSNAGERYADALFHDMRRSAVRNMVRNGVPERVAMAVSGHKTRSIFDRYNIVSEQDLTNAMRQMQDNRPAFAFDPAKAPELQDFLNSKSQPPTKIAIAKIDPKQWGNRPKHGKVIVVPER
jgi:integrase